MPTGPDLVAAARTFLGRTYSTRRPIVCDDGGPLDCSAMITCAARKIGIRNVATNSSGLARSMQAAGTLLPPSKAGTVAGAILIRGPNSGYWGFGPLGHVGIDVGDGVHTIEIGSTRRPVHYGLIAGWRPSNYGTLPGIDTTAPVPAPTPAPTPTPVLIPVGDDMAQIVEQPMRPGEKPRDPLKPQVAILERRRVLLLHGASMSGDRTDGNRRALQLPTPVDLVGWVAAAPGAPGLPGGGFMGGMVALNAEGNPYHLAWS